MTFLLGIDTGGTYTDAVLLDGEGNIIKSAKALTTKYNLAIGIKQAMESVLPDQTSDIKLVSLSTTLATNAIVEGQGSPICLLLIGYDPILVNDLGLEKILEREAIEFISGGHTVNGEEQCPLNLEDAKKAVLAHAPSVAAFGVSGYFSIRNPSHEIYVKRLIRQLSNLPATCGHELTSNLNAPRRALTVALNARIIPLIQQLVLAVRKTMEHLCIRAPLMVVKGDGSLIDAQMAIERPVETILSGPAASVVGARFLNDVDDCFVIDMGGTTTDIAVLSGGKPRLSQKGASVGKWNTMVEAIEVHTTGIGGDSEVRFDEKGKMIIGPRRVVPLNLLASQYPGIVEALKDQNAAYEKKGASDLKDLAGRFIMCQRPLWTRKETLSSMHQEIWELLNDVPIAFSELQRKIKYPALYKKSLYELVDQGLVIVSAFTPTDALHVLGKYQNGSIEAAELGARLLSNQLYLNIKDFCEKVAAQVSIQVGQAVIKTQLTQEGISLSDHDKAAMLFMDRMLGADDGKGFSASFKLKNPLVAIGAPVKCYIPWVGSKFNTHVYISEHAAVGNAVGAASGSIIQSVRILIRPFDGGRLYRAYLPSGIRDFTDLSDAVSCAKDIAHRLAEYHAILAGAKMAHVQVEQHDRILQDSGKWLDEAYFETEVVAVAVGRPQAVT